MKPVKSSKQRTHEEGVIRIATYSRNRLSDGAQDAYRRGEKPASKWTKTIIMVTLRNKGVAETLLKRLSRLPLPILREKLLSQTGRYPTSCWFRVTNFYTVTVPDEQTVSACEKLAGSRASAVRAKKEAPRMVIAWYTVWTGTRRKPRAEEHIATGIIRGQWFYGDDGIKKSIHGRWFVVKKEC